MTTILVNKQYSVKWKNLKNILKNNIFCEGVILKNFDFMSGDLEQNFLKIDNFQSKFLKIWFLVRLPLKIPRSGGITEKKIHKIPNNNSL